MADYGIEPLDRLIDAFRMLDGIGRKTAVRLAFNVLTLSEDKVRDFAGAILEVKEKIGKCSVCCNISASDICPICASNARDKSVICVVEDPRAVMAIERVKDYNGVYHVLNGSLSPVRGINADQLTINELVDRIRLGGSDENHPAVTEVILATNPDVEGEATAMYLARQLSAYDIRVTRIANGVPVGGDLEYADEMTLYRAIEGRRKM